MRRWLVLLILPFVVSAVLHAQAAIGFDVASLKVNAAGGLTKSEGVLSAGGTGSVIEPPRGNQFRAQNASVRTLIRYAYGQTGSNGAIVRPLELERVIGGPAWVDDLGFDIEARMDERGTDPVARMAMLQSLLAERFALRIRREAREQPVYALVPARADRRPGPYLQRLTGVCAPIVDSRTEEEAPCAVRTGPGRLTGHGVAMAAVATYLTPVVGRIVIDRTGMTGRFDVALRFAITTNGLPEAKAAALVGDAPLIFTAVQEQLGLRLEATRAPVDLVVIDHVEKPTAN